jgi:hypothetical protein
MKPTQAKLLVRVLGSVAGLFGVCPLCYEPFQLYGDISGKNVAASVIDALALALGFYFLYVAYLVWFRFSRCAVQHACAVLGFCVYMVCSMLCYIPVVPPSLWSCIAGLVGMLMAFAIYRIANKRLSRLLFPDSAAGVRV